MVLQMNFICVTIKVDFVNETINYQTSHQPLFHQGNFISWIFFYIQGNLKGHQRRSTYPIQGKFLEEFGCSYLTRLKKGCHDSQ